MKLLLLGILVCLNNLVFGQVFHFNDTSAVLIKTTNQSPAHWYLEIISDLQVDTNLRWVSHFSTIPSQWVISFDDGTYSDNSIADLDSADFLLTPTGSFPLKLIIGATLNNTPGHGIVYFDIFDPDNRSIKQTISYEFIITEQGAGLEELAQSTWYSIQHNKAVISEDIGRITLYNELGMQLDSATNELDLCAYKGIYFIEFRSGTKTGLIRVFL